MDKCDVCGSDKNIIAGRWIFYCPEHKSKDWEMTYENEISGDLESGNMDYINNDGELQEMMLENL
jgi:hypothetical protein